VVEGLARQECWTEFQGVEAYLETRAGLGRNSKKCLAKSYKSRVLHAGYSKAYIPTVYVGMSVDDIL